MHLVQQNWGSELNTGPPIKNKQTKKHLRNCKTLETDSKHTTWAA